MKRSARGIFGVGKKYLFGLLCSLILVLCLPSLVHAQSETAVNSDVPQNQHTGAQVAFIEGSAALICQIAGIDIVHPDKGCLGIDQSTGKIGYAPQAGNNPQQVGGVLGLTSSLMGALYQPPASGTRYVAELRNNFGIVKKAYAQNASGFDALAPVQKLWTISRNICYALLVLVFILIGLGIMLRVKIDPRTVMTIQNQIPKIVVAILLITFSYSIIGFMVDLMWLTTYVGINSVSASTTETICDDGTTQELSVGESAYANLLNSPLAFMNDILKHPEEPGIIFGNPTECDLGIKYLSLSVGSQIGGVLTDIIQELFGIDNKSCGILDLGCYAGNGIAMFIGWIGQVLMFLISFIAILIVMLRLWWQLLKAYALIVFYTILGPFWIVLGLLPNSERNFNSWMRTVTAKLAAFPAAALMIVIARVVLDTYNQAGSHDVDPSKYFMPPLTGNPNLGLLGPLLAFAILLIAPDVLNMLNDAFKAPANKYVGPAITGGVAAGLAVGAPATLLAKRGMKYDQAGVGRGFISAPLQRWASGRFKEGSYSHDENEAPPPRAKRIANRTKIGVARAVNLAFGGHGTGGGSTH